MARHERTITKMDQQEWRAVASQMFIIERESSNLINMLRGRTRLRAVDRFFKLDKAIMNLKSDLENEMFYQGIRDINIFYAGEENKERAIEELMGARERLATDSQMHPGSL